MNLRPFLKLRAVVMAALCSLGCTSAGQKVTFTQPLKLGGVEVSPQVLNRGRQSYVHYCYACHGLKGDGHGPAAKGYRPPPRDFTSGTFKFAGVPAGEGLPRDEDLLRIVRHGLWGTPMLAWDVPEEELKDIIQYIKTFYPGWKEEEVFKGIPLDTDPWVGKEKEAELRGRTVYHGFTQCYSCHPAYATRQEIYGAAMATRDLGAKPPTSFRANLYQPEAKEADIKVSGHKMKILPPDFLFNKVRSGTTVKDLYRTVAGGVQPVMPQWYGSLPDKEIWAIAYYVKSLIDAKDTPDEVALRSTLESQPEWKPPGG